MAGADEPIAPRRLRLELPFVVTAMASLLAATVWMALHPSLFLQFFYSPQLLALTHLVTLGFITSMMMGVLFRLAPMAMRVAPRSAWIGMAQYACFALGMIGMIVHFAIARWGGLAWAALAVLASGLLQLWNLAGVFRRAREGDWIARYVAAALVHFVLAAALGAAYGLQNAYGIGARVLTAPFVPRISAHFHLAAIGWVTTMILGLQLKLVPTTAGTSRSRALRFLLLQGGLAGLVLSLLLDLGAEAPFALLIVASVVWHAWAPLRSIRLHPDWAPEAAALGILVLLAATGVLLTLGIPPPGSPLRLRVELAYGYAALLGWVTLTITATAFKLFPLWVWRDRFLPEWQASRPVPAAASLWSRPLRTLTTVALTAGVLATAAGIVLEAGAILGVSLWIVLVGIASFALNLWRTARWVLLDREYGAPPGARIRPGRPD